MLQWREWGFQKQPFVCLNPGSTTCNCTILGYLIFLCLLHACMCAKSLQSCLSLCNPMDCSPLGSSVHEDSPGKNTGVGCHGILQGIFQTQELNPCLLCFLHWQVGSLTLAPLVKQKNNIKKPKYQIINVSPCFGVGSLIDGGGIYMSCLDRKLMRTWREVIQEKFFL